MEGEYTFFPRCGQESGVLLVLEDLQGGMRDVDGIVGVWDGLFV